MAHESAAHPKRALSPRRRNVCWVVCVICIAAGALTRGFTLPIWALLPPRALRRLDHASKQGGPVRKCSRMLSCCPLQQRRPVAASGWRIVTHAESDENFADGMSIAGSSVREVRIDLGPGKGELIAYERKSLEEEDSDVDKFQAGNMSLDEFNKKYGKRLFGEGNGWTVFPASRFLAQFVVQCPSFFKDKVVVELGCGCGVAGLAAAKAGAREVWLTDKDPTVLELARTSAAANGMGDNVKIVELDWGNVDTWPDPLPPVDIIIGADILYNNFAHEALVKVLVNWLPDHGRAMLADPRQRYMRPQFQRVCGYADLENTYMIQTQDMVLLNIMPLALSGSGQGLE